MTMTTLTHLNEQMLKAALRGDAEKVFLALTLGADPLYGNGRNLPISVAFALRRDLASVLHLARINPATLRQKSPVTGATPAGFIASMGAAALAAVAALDPKVLEDIAPLETFSAPETITEKLAKRITAGELICLGQINPNIMTKAVLARFARRRDVKHAEVDQLIKAGFTN